MIMQSSVDSSVSTPADKASLFQRSRLAAAIGITSLMLVAGMNQSVLAAKGGVPGKPGGAGGGSPDLGDLIVLYRDAWGVPILTEDSCQQPLAAPDEVLLPNEDIDFEGCSPEPGESCVLPVNPETCAVAAGYETYTQETDFGRTSVIRSPVTVIEQALGEVVTKLATAQCTSLDPAGRLVNTSEIDEELLSATIDSPLESLAIYRQLVLTGSLGVSLPEGADVLDTAARGLGAATDKSGKVTVDQIVYSNEIMGLTDESVQTYLPKICMNVREEVSGTVQEVRKCFLNYGLSHPEHTNIGVNFADYQYARTDNFSKVEESLPAPAYIPREEDGGPMNGWFEYLGVLDPSTPSFQILQGPILDSVFCVDDDTDEPVVPESGICSGDNDIDPGFLGGNIGGFAQAADDAREVIEFTHDRPLPLGYETPVPPCDNPDTDLDYDVSISEESGLQVPKRMIADAEEPREIILTVANSGPDTATGEVTLIGTDANGEEVFSETDEFTIPGGETNVSKWLFSLNYPTTVSWTATASADDDLNTGNNTVYASTRVMTTGGGNNGGQGGSGGPASASSKGRSGK